MLVPATGDQEGPVRALLMGGTRFIGRALLAELLAAGHEVLVVHRGRHEPADLPGGDGVRHLHANRRALAPQRPVLAAFCAEVVVDLCAMTGPDAEALLAALPGDPRLVVASSQDVYRAFGSVLAGTETDPLPVDEAAPVRAGPLPPRPQDDPDWDFDERAYDKLDVERAYLARGGAVLRLPLVYGEHDYQRREEPLLRRVRAGRRQVPVGAGTFLWSKGWVGDVARALRLAAETPAAAGQVLNVCESRTASMGLWCRWVLDAAGARDAELVRVPEELVPEDLRLTRSVRQHLLVDAGRARALLGWRDHDPLEATRRSVAWHLANPPPGGPGGFAADDRALAGR
jgi:nucleoside-diphosphate-sugar epimerase